MWLADPGGPADPAATRDQVRELLSGDQYSYAPSLVERVLNWIAEQLDKLMPDAGPPGATGTFTGGIGAVLAWVLIAVAVLAVVAAVVYVVLRRVRKVEVDEAPPTELEVEHRRTVRQWRDDAATHEAAGEWKEAVRAHYRALVRELTDRRQLPDVAGRTTRELRADLADTTPDATEDFDTASLLFELPWYADVPTGPDEVATFRTAAAAVLAAPHVQGTEQADDVVELEAAR